MQETGLAGIADFDEGFADSLITTVSAEPELQLFQFEMLLESRRNPKTLSMVEGLYETYVGTVEEALSQRGLDTTGGASLAIFAALDGLMLQFLTITNPTKIRSAVIQVGKLVSGLPKSSDTAGRSAAQGPR
ncbi:hypothetical protein [Arthrobacter sp. efr-133-TYG-104]|uniref:hypothetical protein n=1 Tax=Arthrobacter sp. efr-133-TYG-104 TaxID=3040324 RepID=UPI002550E5B5|nr:hypothetical protein [Arthrobacter sp. efr-133-TYG-104]